MTAYLVRQPIFEVASGKICGYEVVYKDESGRSGQTVSNEDVAKTITYLFASSEQQFFTEGKPIYLTFTTQLIQENVSRLFDKNKLVIQIDDSTSVNTKLLEDLYELRQEGYKFVFNDFMFAQRYFNLLDLVDIISLDLEATPDYSLTNITKVCLGLKKTLLATNVNTREDLERAKSFGFHKVQGRYFSEPELVSPGKKLEYNQAGFLRLMSQLAQPEPKVDEIAATISSDVTMSYQLLKLVNSSYYALRTKVGDIKHAIVIVGMRQLLDWVYLLKFESISDKDSEILIRLAFQRGEICRTMSKEIPALSAKDAECYLVGMFSILDVLLENSLENILRELPLNEEVHNALLKREGLMGALFSLVLAYERADWREVSRLADELRLSGERISECYMNCVKNVTKSWGELVSPMY